MMRQRLLAGMVVPLIFAFACTGDAPTTAPLIGPPVFARGGGSTVRLQVNKPGTGTGTVTSNPSGINCGSSCSKSFSPGTVVTLTATPSSGSAFAGWSGGGCSGTGNCTLTVSSNTTVTATFNTSGGGGGLTLTVNKIQTGNGSGSVSSTPSGISCDPTCSANFPAGTSITLNEEPSTGRFAGWSGGGCSGTSPSCTLALTANTTVTATFETEPLTITTASLPDGNRGAKYNEFLTSSGGMGSPDKYSLVSGSLPSGLTMAESFGVQSTLISGTPTQEQISTFTVRVQDQSGSSTKTFTIRINPPTPVVVTMPGETSQSGTVGTAYFQNLFASGGKTPYSWSVTAGQLPPGLQLIRASNGNRIEGTPTTRGTFTFTLTVTDSLGQKATQQTSITVT